MIHNTDLNYEEKLEKLKELPLSGDTINRLFFAARNGAIERLRLAVQTYFDDRGYRVRCLWNESSMGNPAFQIALHEKKDTHTRFCWIEREKMWPPPALNDNVSSVTYRLKNIGNGEYYRYRKPKRAEEFDAILGSEEFFEFLAREVNGVNYPFTYESHSCF